MHTFLSSGQIVANINTFIGRLHAEMKYRPTAVAVIENSRNQFLLVQSKDAGRWGFLQGGIEKNEDLAQALKREIWEESGITAEQFDLGHHFLLDRVPRPVSGEQRFSLGAFYFYSHIRYRGSPEICINTDELRDYRWYSWREALEFLGQLRAPTYRPKRESLVKALMCIPPVLAT